MSIQLHLKRTGPIIISAIVTVVIALNYYFTGFTDITANTNALAIKVASVFFFTGSISLILYHIKRARSMKENWVFSIITLAIVTIMVALGQFWPKGVSSTEYTLVYNYLMLEVSKGIGVISFAWTLVALWKSYRLTSFNGLFVFIGGIICLLGAPPFASLIGTAGFFNWFTTNILGTNAKVFDVLGSIGAVYLVIRTLSGLEKSFMSVEIAKEEG